MKLYGIKITAFALVILLSISSCGNMIIDQENDSTELSATVASPSDESADLEHSYGLIPGSGDLLPDGVLVSMDDGAGLTYLDADGQVLLEIETPGIGSADPENVVVAGTVIPGKSLPSIIYHSWEPEQALMANTGGRISTLRQVTSFLSVIGAPGQSVIAFSEVIINPDNFPHSFLYAGGAANLGGIESFYDLIDEPTYMRAHPTHFKEISHNYPSFYQIIFHI